jgi:hypothetical protein
LSVHGDGANKTKVFQNLNDKEKGKFSPFLFSSPLSFKKKGETVYRRLLTLLPDFFVHGLP